MGDLSEHFSRAEFVCKCGCDRANIDPKLIEALELLRNLVGEPIHITEHGGFRCPKQNQRVKGSDRSRHMKGKAADIWIGMMTPAEMAIWAEQVPAFRDGGIGVYPKNGFIHVDVRRGRSRW